MATVCEMNFPYEHSILQILLGLSSITRNHASIEHFIFLPVLNAVGTITTGVDSLRIESSVIDTSPNSFKVTHIMF
jgi:hypothetical protein